MRSLQWKKNFDKTLPLQKCYPQSICRRDEEFKSKRRLYDVSTQVTQNFHSPMFIVKDNKEPASQAKKNLSSSAGKSHLPAGGLNEQKSCYRKQNKSRSNAQARFCYNGNSYSISRISSRGMMKEFIDGNFL